jgi:hypothetical protein
MGGHHRCTCSGLTGGKRITLSRRLRLSAQAAQPDGNECNDEDSCPNWEATPPVMAGDPSSLRRHVSCAIGQRPRWQLRQPPYTENGPHHSDPGRLFVFRLVTDVVPSVNAI